VHVLQLGVGGSAHEALSARRRAPQDHKPTAPEEKARILKANGRVERWVRSAWKVAAHLGVEEETGFHGRADHELATCAAQPRSMKSRHVSALVACGPRLCAAASARLACGPLSNPLCLPSFSRLRLVDEMNQPMGPYRVWLQYAWIPGLAMSRALGDVLAHQ
jgi:hypothetical protein